MSFTLKLVIVMFISIAISSIIANVVERRCNLCLKIIIKKKETNYIIY